MYLKISAALVLMQTFIGAALAVDDKKTTNPQLADFLRKRPKNWRPARRTQPNSIVASSLTLSAGLPAGISQTVQESLPHVLDEARSIIGVPHLRSKSRSLAAVSRKKSAQQPLAPWNCGQMLAVVLRIAAKISA